MMMVSVWSQVQVISPCSGVWANAQPLVLEVPHDAEVFYTTTGGDPLVSGFAYDGPVMLEGTGEQKLTYITVKNGVSSAVQEISWTVEPATPLTFITPPVDGVIPIDASNSLSIPQNYSYAMADQSMLITGRELILEQKTSIMRYLPIKITDGSLYWRYVLQVGGDAEELDANVQFSPAWYCKDWDYVMFTSGKSIVFSIDDQELRESPSGIIHIDRTADHEFKWRFKDSPTASFKTEFLPARPSIIGAPSGVTVNTGVSYEISDPDYCFGYKTPDGKTHFYQKLSIDTLYGDSVGFSAPLTVYFQGIPQAVYTPIFIVDKLPPAPPTVESSNLSKYSRSNVMLTVNSGEEVYYYVSKVEKQGNGFLDSEIQQFSFSPNALEENQYLLLENDYLQLAGTENTATFVTVFLFSKDKAGNKSSPVLYTTVIDPWFYYVSNNNISDGTIPDGTQDKPFISIESMISLLNKGNPVVIYINGTYNSVPSFNITANTILRGSDVTRIKFAKGNLISIQQSDFSAVNCSFEFTDTPEAITAVGGNVSLTNVELALEGSDTGIGLQADTVNINLLNTGFTVKSKNYASGFSLSDSNIVVDGSRVVVLSDTVVAFSIVDSIFDLQDSSITVLGTLARCAEIVRSQITMGNSLFQAKKNNPSVSAIWVDKKSTILKDDKNTINGFKSFIQDRK